MKGLVISVGGSPEPVIHSVNKNRPDAIVFFTSVQSAESLKYIIKEIKDFLDISDENILEHSTPDPEDLTVCYEEAVKAFEKLKAMNADITEITADFTGGTKSMTAAMALAAVGGGYRFTYVAGSQRTKEGLGIVVSGTETLLQSGDPWEIFSVEEKKSIKELYKIHEYKAAADLALKLEKRYPKKKKYQKLHYALLSVHYEDMFLYKRAAEFAGKLNPDSIGNQEEYHGFVKAVHQRRERLQKLAGQEGPSIEKIHDLYANAIRRSEQGRYDDAIIRLYRLTEMHAQYRLKERFGLDAGDLDLTRIPETVKNYKRFCDNKDKYGKAKAGLLESYELLYELEDHEGGRLYSDPELYKRMRTLMDNRNSSLLIHGFRSLTQEDFERTREIVLKAGIVNESALERLPQFD